MCRCDGVLVLVCVAATCSMMSWHCDVLRWWMWCNVTALRCDAVTAACVRKLVWSDLSPVYFRDSSLHLLWTVSCFVFSPPRKCCFPHHFWHSGGICGRTRANTIYLCFCQIIAWNFSAEKLFQCGNTLFGMEITSRFTSDLNISVSLLITHLMLCFRFSHCQSGTNRKGLVEELLFPR